MLVGAVVVVALIAAVAAVALSGGGTPAATKTAAQPRTSPLPAVAPLAPVALVAKAAPFSVALSWTLPTGGGEVIGYKVFRDGVLVGTVSSPTTMFEDSNVLPGKLYTYEVLSRGTGVEESDTVSAQLKTPVPALSAARVSGDFDVKITKTSQFGFDDTLTGGTAGWNFEPKCGEGACSVVWKHLNFEGIKGTLVRKGVSYRGSDSGKIDVTCGGKEVASTLTLQFKVVKAQAINGEWRAVKLVGTLIEREKAALGCRSSGADYKFSATLYD